MTTRTFIAGEWLEDLEAALDLFELALDERGCLVMTATLPDRLSKCLNRALKAIAAQMAADMDIAALEERNLDPMSELFNRIGEIRAGQE